MPDSEIDYSDIPPLDLSKVTLVPMEKRHTFTKKNREALVP
jgi:hypothetical protein